MGGRFETPVRAKLWIKAKEVSIDAYSRANHLEMSTRSPSPESASIKCRQVQAKKGHVGLCPTHLNQRDSGESPGWKLGFLIQLCLIYGSLDT